MAIGKNGQFYYSPDIAVYIQTARDGVINISEDIMSFTIQRQLNGVSTAQIILANFGFKYTPGSNVANTAPGVIPPQPVINTMDQITIFLKRTEYFQVLTGFVTYAPVISIMPTPVSIQASCTLYKAQNSYWDSGSLDFAGLIPNYLYNQTSNDYKDGGAGQGMVNILHDVCNWPAENIRIGTIPQKWFDFAAGVEYKAPTPPTQAAGNPNGSSGLEYVTQLTKNKTALYVNGTKTTPAAPLGTNLPTSIGCIKESASSLMQSARFLENATIQNPHDLLNNNVNFWIAMPLPFVAPSIPNGSWHYKPDPKLPDPKSWVAGGSDPKKYAWPWPADSTYGRIIQLRSSGGGIVWVNVVEVLPYDSPLAILSPAAYDALSGANYDPNVGLKVTVDGWINPATIDTATLEGRVFNNAGANASSDYVPGVTPKPSTGTHEKKTSLTGVFDSVAQVQSVIKDELNIKFPSTMDSYTWAYVLLRSLGVPAGSPTLARDPSHPSYSVSNIARWINAEGVYWLWEQGDPGMSEKYPPDGHSYNDPLDTSLDTSTTPQVQNQSRGNSISPFSYETVAQGIFATQQTLLTQSFSPRNGGVTNYKAVIAALTSNASVNEFAAALEPTGWGGANTYGGSKPRTQAIGINNALIKLGNPGWVTNQANWSQNAQGGQPTSYTSIPGQGAAGTANNPNFNITGIVPGVSPAGTILEGLPNAFIVDEQALSTISTLATGGLRVFQSAPSGDFVSWFPDYFGLYGTRASMQIFDIEIMDLKIYHDDTQLTTHSAVSGDTTGIGESVTLNDWLSSQGIISVTSLNMLRLLFGINTADKTKKLAKIFGLKADAEVPAYFMQRYGLRPYVDEEPLIHSHTLEIAFALQSFLYLWSKQYATEVMLTFMPELYPGMIVQLPEHNLQMFVLNVTHQGSRDGGFTTQATFTCPTLVNIEDVTTGKIKGDPIPYHYGYPINPSK